MSGFLRPWHAHYDSGIPAEISWPKQPVHSFLENAARDSSGLPHLEFLGRSFAYGETHALASRFAAALQGLGVKKGDRVALFLPNCPQMVFGYFGALYAGAVVIPTNPLYTERELEHQLVDSGAEVILVLSKFLPLVQSVRAKTKLRHVVVTNIKEYMPGLLRLLFTIAKEKKDGHRVPFPRDGATHALPELLSAPGARHAPVAVAPSDLCLLQYTGGTTGAAKGAMLTHENLVSNVVMCQAWLRDLTPGKETFLCSLPFFHVFGMTVCQLLGTSIAAKLVLVPDPKKVDEVLKAIAKHHPTIFPGVPRMYAVLLDHPKIGNVDLRSIRNCISGAAPLPLEISRRWEKVTGGKLVEGYGLTEASPVTHGNPLDGVRKEGHIGLPFPSVDCKLVDVEEEAKIVAPGEKGVLCVKGPNVMKGYWNRPDETASAIRDGWLHTGDIAIQDADGYFQIVDRKKELILVGGFNVYPRDVEEVLFAHPAVADCAVAGVPDAKRATEEVCAFVVLRAGASASADDLLAHCRKGLTAYKVPKRILFRTDLPKTPVGKVLRRILVAEEKAKLAAT